MLRTSSPTPLLTLSALLLAHLGRAFADRLQFDSPDDGSAIRCGHPKYARVPCFDDQVKNDVVVQAGRTAVLRCIVFNAKMKAVTWDKAPIGPIAIGDMIFIRDKRFSVRRQKSTDYSLEIRAARKTDSGIYRCQINLEKLKEKLFKLTVEDPVLPEIRNAAPGEDDPKKNPAGPRPNDFPEVPKEHPGNMLPSVMISGRDVVYVGQVLRLSCFGRYQQPMSSDATLDWFHYGVRKRSEMEERLTIRERILNSTTLSSLLRVSPVTADNSGPWVCVKRPTNRNSREFAEIKITVVKPIPEPNAAPTVRLGKRDPDNASSRALTSPLVFLLLLACPGLGDGVL